MCAALSKEPQPQELRTWSSCRSGCASTRALRWLHICMRVQLGRVVDASRLEKNLQAGSVDVRSSVERATTSRAAHVVELSQWMCFYSCTEMVAHLYAC